MSDLTQDERAALPESDFADPQHRKFPIVDANDVQDAWNLAGHAEHPDAVRRRIIQIAKRKGLTSALPESAREWAQEHNVELAADHAQGASRRATFAASGAATLGEAGLFEVMLITEGQGNGWNFSEKVLRESLQRWEGAECFVDHIGGWGREHSVRDLCGVFYDVSFDETAKGVRAKLKSLGPSGPLVAALGREWLMESEPRPAVGFSADVGFKANGREVAEILRVYSVDLVFDPARGGAFIRALNSVGGRSRQIQGGPMVGETTPAAQTQTVTAAEVNQNIAAMKELLDLQKEQARLQAEAEEARKVRAQMCAYLLDSGLAASKLPSPVQERIRKQFAGQVFEPSELTAAIDDARKIVSDLTGGASVQGLKAAVSGMFNSDDQLQAAVYDLFDAERPENLKGLTVARLSGIKELYLGLTGDVDLYGGIYPERARFQHTTATFPGLVKNALNKALVTHWNLLGRAGYDWWKKIARVEHFDSLNQITWIIFGSVGSLPSVAEGAEYSELKIGDSPETSSFTKYGGYIGLTLEAIDRDQTRKLRAVPRELANAALRNISSLCAAVFTANSGVGPTMADGGALFNSTAVTTVGGHANLLTGALSASQWDTVQAAVYNQPMLVANETGYYGTGKKLAVNPRYLLVPRALWLTGAQILYPAHVYASQINSENQQRGEVGDVIVVPEWTDANDWAAVCDPDVVPGIMIGERFGLLPEIYIAGDETSPAVFSNDESRIKVRHFIAVGVCDFRPLHKENV